jgi:thiamine biosynthesis protein ThiS
MNESAQLEIELNGEAFFVESGSTIKELLEKLASDSGNLNRRLEAVAVELNAEIVPKDRFEQTVLDAGDSVEVVTLVGGG